MSVYADVSSIKSKQYPLCYVRDKITFNSSTYLSIVYMPVGSNLLTNRPIFFSGSDRRIRRVRGKVLLHYRFWSVQGKTFTPTSQVNKSRYLKKYLVMIYEHKQIFLNFFENVDKEKTFPYYLFWQQLELYQQNVCWLIIYRYVMTLDFSDVIPFAVTSSIYFKLKHIYISPFLGKFRIVSFILFASCRTNKLCAILQKKMLPLKKIICEVIM